MQLSRNRSAAFSLTELLLTVAILALLAVVFLPGLARRHARSSRIGCVNNLKQIGLAFVTWGVDHNDRFPMHVSLTNGGTMELAASGSVFSYFQVMSNELSIPQVLVCPEDKARTCSTNWTSDFGNKNVSYFVGLDSVEGSNTSLLSGDRNLTNNLTAGSRLLTLTTNVTLGWTKEIHFEKGNICFADGSVDQFTNGHFAAANEALGLGTNRLAVP